MKQKITIISKEVASLFFIKYFLAVPSLTFFAECLRRLYSRYDIKLIGNNSFTYFPAMPELITWKKDKKNLCLNIRPFLKRRNIFLIDDAVTEILGLVISLLTMLSIFTDTSLFLCSKTRENA